MFIIIWRGRGIVVVGFALLGMLAMSLLGELVGGRTFGVTAQGVALGVGLLAAAIPVWVLGWRWNAPQQDRVLIAEDTGQRLVLPWRPRHTLYYVPMQYWAFVLAAVGTLWILGSLVRS